MIKLTLYKSCKNWKIYLECHLSGLLAIRDGEEREREVNTSELAITILNSASRSSPAHHFV